MKVKFMYTFDLVLSSVYKNCEICNSVPDDSEDEDIWIVINDKEVYCEDCASKKGVKIPY